MLAEAHTVFLLAPAFAAAATSFVLGTLEGLGVLLQGQNPCAHAHPTSGLSVSTLVAGTGCSAVAILCKTLTVQLQTLRLLALAAAMRLSGELTSLRTY